MQSRLCAVLTTGRDSCSLEPGWQSAAVCWLRCETRVRDWRQRPSIAYSTPSTPRSPVVWAWGCRSAVRSLKRMADDCGRVRICLMAPVLNSPFLPTQTPHREWMVGHHEGDEIAID